METICRNTKYYEIDESVSPKEDCSSQADFTTLTDTLTSVDSDLSRERRSSVTDNDDGVGSEIFIPLNIILVKN